jgi:hypothetical protein
MNGDQVNILLDLIKWIAISLTGIYGIYKMAIRAILKKHYCQCQNPILQTLEGNIVLHCPACGKKIEDKE